MKIVLDMQAAQSESRLRGIGRYSLSLARALIRNAGPHDIYVSLNHVFPDTIEPLKAALGSNLPESHVLVYRSLPKSMSRDPANEGRNKAGQLIRESYFASLGADVVHTFSMFEGWGDDSVVSTGLLPGQSISSATIHDLIPYADPDKYLPTPEHKSWYSEQLESLRRCDVLLSNSEYTRQTAIELLGLSDEAIVSASAGADPLFSPADTAIAENQQRLEQLGICGPFIMYAGVIGREDPRKNFAGLLRAYGLLTAELRRQYQLVLVGRYTAYDFHDLNKEAAQLGVEPGQLVFTGRVDDEDLVLLYSACHLFVFPSLEEGFGLPALEAMRCGAAVIGSNTSSIPEVIGNPAALFDPYSSDDIARAMTRALSDETLRQSFIEQSATQSEKFSWDSSAQIALATWEQKQAERSTGSHFCQPAVSNPPVAESEAIDPLLKAALAQIRLDGALAQQDLVYCAQAIAENQPRPTRRKLMLDVSVLIHLDAQTGIQRVVRSLLIEFTRTPVEDTDVQLVYLDLHGDFRVANYSEGDLSSLQRRSEDALLDVAAGDIYVGLDLDLEGIVIQSRNAFLCYHRQRGLKVYYLVYDLLPIVLSRHFHIGVQQRFPLWLNTVSSQADGLICISRAVADELKAWLDINGPERHSPLNLGYFHLGADIESSAPTAGLPKNALAMLHELREQPTILMVATIEPRKGQQQALDAIEQLWNEGIELNLVLVGKSGWAMEKFEKRLAQHPENGKRLHWLKGISDEMLQHVYAESSLLLAASAGEGFGLPLIEAAQHGLPILARDIPVFHEVAGEHALYFSGNEPEALASAIRQWIKLRAAGEVPCSSGVKWLNWSESAEQLKILLLEQDEWYLKWQPELVTEVH